MLLHLLNALVSARPPTAPRKVRIVVLDNLRSRAPRIRPTFSMPFRTRCLRWISTGIPEREGETAHRIDREQARPNAPAPGADIVPFAQLPELVSISRHALSFTDAP
jgi:hypothetical protein